MTTATLDTTSTQTPTQTPWTDSKRLLWMLGLLVPMYPFICFALAQLTGSGAWWWFAAATFYGIIPLLDTLIGDDQANPPDAQVAQLEAQPWYRGIVFAYIPLQYAGTILGAWAAMQGGLAWWELAGLIVTLGIVNGVGINTAHELGHKTVSLERWLAKLALAPVAYGHFYVEHNRGHHVRAATPEDPASSRMGESFWAFLPRTVIGSVRSAWELEKARLARRGHGVWHWENENLQAWSMTVLFFGALAIWLGPWVLPLLIAQAAYGASLLEVVNYLEHYGLRRQKQADGRYERVRPVHSWNCNHVVTNLFLYQLQRHSDHHANPTRRYQALRHFEESPQLPSGYASLIPLAYVPFLWFWLMDKRVVAHYEGDLRYANLQPAQRDKLLRRYPPPV